jgi:hypothetical protein
VPPPPRPSLALKPDGGSWLSIASNAEAFRAANQVVYRILSGHRLPSERPPRQAAEPERRVRGRGRGRGRGRRATAAYALPPRRPPTEPLPDLDEMQRAASAIGRQTGERFAQLRRAASGGYVAAIARQDLSELLRQHDESLAESPIGNGSGEAALQILESEVLARARPVLPGGSVRVMQRQTRAMMLTVRDQVWRSLPQLVDRESLLGRRIIGAVAAHPHFSDKRRLVRELALAAAEFGKARKQLRYWRDRVRSHRHATAALKPAADAAAATISRVIAAATGVKVVAATSGTKATNRWTNSTVSPVIAVNAAARVSAALAAPTALCAGQNAANPAKHAKHGTLRGAHRRARQRKHLALQDLKRGPPSAPSVSPVNAASASSDSVRTTELTSSALKEFERAQAELDRCRAVLEGAQSRLNSLLAPLNGAGNGIDSSQRCSWCGRVGSGGLDRKPVVHTALRKPKKAVHAFLKQRSNKHPAKPARESMPANNDSNNPSASSAKKPKSKPKRHRPSSHTNSTVVIAPDAIPFSVSYVCRSLSLVCGASAHGSACRVWRAWRAWPEIANVLGSGDIGRAVGGAKVAGRIRQAGG